MLSSRVAGLARNTLCRNFSQSAVRRSGHYDRTRPGDNIPFDINNKFKLTAWFIVFLGSGFGLPFYVWQQKEKA